MGGIYDDVLSVENFNFSGGTAPQMTANGQLIIGDGVTGIPHVALPLDGTNISWTFGAGTIQPNLTGVISVSQGGTGRISLTDHAVLVGAGVNPVGLIPMNGDGVLLIGRAGLDPVAANLTAGGGIAITNAAGAVTITATGGGLPWTNINASQTLVVNTGVNCTGGAALSLALPAASSVGDIIRVVLDGSTSFTITQAANQQVRVGALTTTLGVGGSITSIAQGDGIELLCKTANLAWTATYYSPLNVV